MKRNEIIKELKKYNLDSKRYIVLSGAAMVLYGIKNETLDIDISVKESLEKELLNQYDAKIEKINIDGTKVYIINSELNFGSNYYTDRKNYIDNIPVQYVEDILSLKLMLNREKDKNDIELIKKYMKHKNSNN